MKTVNKKILYGIAFVLVVTIYTWISVSKSSTSVAEVGRLGSDMPLGLIHDKEVVSNQTLSKTEAYLNEEQSEKEKMQQFERALATKSPEKLTSAFSDTYKSPYDQRMAELKSRDLTPSYTGTTKENNVSEFPNNNSTTKVNNTPQIKRASLPVKRDIEVKEPSKSQHVDDLSYFNLIAIGETDQAQKEGPAESTMIKAAVLGTQEVKSGGFIKFRLLEQAVFNGITYPRNTIFTGTASMGNDRLFARVDRISTKSGYMPISLELHDQDLMQGIYVPYKAGNETASDEALTGVEDILNATGTGVGAAGSGIARIFRSSVNGQQKVSVTDGFQVLFIINEDK